MTTEIATRGLLIGGKEVDALSGRVTDVLNPVTGQVVMRVPAAEPADVTRAVDAAQAASADWAATAPAARRAILQRAADLVEGQSAEFTRILRSETGGTQTWADFNVHLGAQMLREGAAIAGRQVGSLLSTNIPGEWSMAVRAPAGVAAAFIPWNGPLALATRGVVAALATGNPVVIRPSEEAPVASGYFLADILAQAGIPDGVVNIVTNDRADAPAIVEALISDSRVRRVSFTGSTQVGRIVGRLSGEYLKPVLLELGGKNPIIVMDDADLDYATSGVTMAKFYNSGQICLSVDRVILHRSIADAFTEKFLAKVAALPQGDPDNEDTIVGPVINARSATRLTDLVADAVAKGATVLAGGGPANGAFYPATVLTDVTPDMRIYHEEIFGPVATLFRVDTDEEAITLANDTDYGLSSAVYTENATKGLAIARKLRHGAVHVNDSSVADEPQAPVGGIKDSGFGQFFNGDWGAEFFTETRWITLADRHSDYSL